MGKKKDLVQIIRDNPGCVAIVDNDCWTLYKKHPDKNPFHNKTATVDTYEDDEKWDTANELASSDDGLKSLGDGGYGSGNCYGGDILQALAVIVGIKIESV